MKRAISQHQNNSSFNKVLIQPLKQVFKKIRMTLDNLTIVEIHFLLKLQCRQSNDSCPLSTIKNMEGARA